VVIILFKGVLPAATMYTSILHHPTLSRAGEIGDEAEGWCCLSARDGWISHNIFSQIASRSLGSASIPQEVKWQASHRQRGLHPSTEIIFPLIRERDTAGSRKIEDFSGSYRG